MRLLGCRRLERLIEFIGEQVDVGVERERRRVVAEPPLHLLGVAALRGIDETVYLKVWNPIHGTSAS